MDNSQSFVFDSGDRWRAGNSLYSQNRTVDHSPASENAQYFNSAATRCVV